MAKNVALKILKNMNETVKSNKSLANFIRCAVLLKEVANSHDKDYNHGISVQVKSKRGKTIIDGAILERINKGEEIGIVIDSRAKAKVIVESVIDTTAVSDAATD